MRCPAYIYSAECALNPNTIPPRFQALTGLYYIATEAVTLWHDYLASIGKDPFTFSGYNWDS